MGKFLFLLISMATMLLMYIVIFMLEVFCFRYLAWRFPGSNLLARVINIVALFAIFGVICASFYLGNSWALLWIFAEIAFLIVSYNSVNSSQGFSTAHNETFNCALLHCTHFSSQCDYCGKLYWRLKDAEACHDDWRQRGIRKPRYPGEGFPNDPMYGTHTPIPIGRDRFGNWD